MSKVQAATVDSTLALSAWAGHDGGWCGEPSCFHRGGTPVLALKDGAEMLKVLRLYVQRH